MINMRLILLRHEDRYDDFTLLTSLTPDGIRRSTQLSSSLSNLKIDRIYASPFIRTLQTIQPTSICINKPIYVHSDIMEYMHEGVVDPNQYYQMDQEKYNTLIRSEFNLNSIQTSWPSNRESEIDLMKRVRRFTNHLLTLNINTVLIVTHMSVANAIRKLNDPSISLEEMFEMGKFKEIIIDGVKK